MLIEKPYWIQGFGALLCLDIHPDGTRFVTGGADAVVRVWSLKAVSVNPRPVGGGAAVPGLAGLASKDTLEKLAARTAGGSVQSGTIESSLTGTNDNGDGVNDIQNLVRSKSSNGPVSAAAESGSGTALGQTADESPKNESAGEDAGNAAVDEEPGEPGDEQDDEDEELPDPPPNSLLATLARHDKGVNAARWSPDGKFLATGGADQAIILWALKVGEGDVAMFSSASNDGDAEATVNRENWAPVLTFRDHAADVIDLAWAPHSRHMASCSLDSAVLIWDIQAAVFRFQAEGGNVVVPPLRRLKHHTSWVKGLAWDPVGRYLLSSSTDRTIVCWDAHQWTVQSVISKPFEEDKGAANETTFRRLAFSPDGSLVCATNAVQSGKFVAELIGRGGGGGRDAAATWELNGTTFVGHPFPVTVASFNPRIYETAVVVAEQSSDGSPKKSDTSSSSSAASTKTCYCAIGSTDGNFSVWSQALSVPLFTMQNAFDAAVTDIAWSADGKHLLLASKDGTVLMCKFKRADLGKPFSVERQKSMLQSRFGHASTERASFTEAPDLLDSVRDGASERPRVSTTSGTGTKRIAPLITSDGAQPPLLQSTSNGGTDTGGVNKRSRIELLNPAPEITISGGRKRLAPTVLEEQPWAKSLSALDSGGRFGGGSLPGSPARPQVAPSTPNRSSGATARPSGAVLQVPGSVLQLSPSDPSLERRLVAPQTGIVLGHDGVLIHQIVSADDAASWISERGVTGREAGAVSAASSSLAQTNRLSESRAAAESHASSSRGANEGLHGSVTNPETGASGASVSGAPVIVECRVVSAQTAPSSAVGRRQSQNPPSSHVTCVTGNSVLWVTRIPGTATHVAGNQHFVVAATNDGSIHSFNASTGRRLVPAIAMGYDVAFLSVASGQRGTPQMLLVAVNTRGDLRLWDLQSRRLKCECSVAPLLTSQMDAASRANATSSRNSSVSRHAALAGIDVDHLGNIAAHISAVSNQCIGTDARRVVRTYVWESGMRCWVRASCEDFVHSSYYSTIVGDSRRHRYGTSDSNASASQFPMQRLQTETQRLLQAERTAAGLPAALGSIRALAAELPEWSMVDTISHLQHQLALAIALRDTDSFRTWLRTYVRFLARHDELALLKDICDDVLWGGLMAASPAMNTPATEGVAKGGGVAAGKYNAAVLGIKRVAILQDIILPAMSINMSVRRAKFVAEYKDMLTQFSE